MTKLLRNELISFRAEKFSVMCYLLNHA